MVVSPFGLDALGNHAFKALDCLLVSFVKRPFLNTLAAKKPGPRQDFQVLGHSRMTHAQLAGDQ